MAYQALYRVWRSQRFDEIVGQKAVTQTLKNAIIQEQISHAYLFTGPRGTGKTSAAKIFAKAINCPNRQNGEPCNECEICRAITAGALDDVVEIDAASNNGVEEIRFIRERANYAPTQAKYKIYIIDEVHMLSTGAFNALLKTLEEPKQNVIFILATTEPHKIPATIISRTQRFDFKRIQTADIVEHLTHILKTNELLYEPGALDLIARAAEGGMRDALSILDQAISFSEGQLTMADALEVTGGLTAEKMDLLVSAWQAQETAQALAQLNEILADGKEARRLLENLLTYCRDLLIYQQAPKMLADKTTMLTEDFKQLAQAVTSEQVYEWIQILNDTQNEVRLTTNPKIYLEVAMVKLTSNAPPAQGGQSVALAPSRIQELEQLKVTVQQLQKEIQSLKTGSGLPTSGAQETLPTRKGKINGITYRLPKEKVYQVLKGATKNHLAQVKQVWEELLTYFTPTQRAMLKSSEVKAASPEGLVIAFEYEIICQRAANDEELKLMIHNQLSRLIPDYAPEVVFIPKDAWGSLRKEYLENYHTASEEPAAIDFEGLEEGSTLAETKQADLVVEKAQELFGELATIVENEE